MNDEHDDETETAHGDGATGSPEPADEAFVVTRRLQFAFDPRYERMLAVLGIHSNAAWASVGRELEVRFGPWHVVTPTANVSSASVAGPYTPAKVLGPRLSLKDRGVTFGTNADRGVCVTFVEPVIGLDPWGWWHHPNMTVTLANPDEAVEVFRRLGVRDVPAERR
jgi:hypothetical protein